MRVCIFWAGVWKRGDGALRVSRGGSWDRNASYCRSAYRPRPRPKLPLLLPRLSPPRGNVATVPHLLTVDSQFWSGMSRRRLSARPKEVGIEITNMFECDSGPCIYKTFVKVSRKLYIQKDTMRVVYGTRTTLHTSEKWCRNRLRAHGCRHELVDHG